MTTMKATRGHAAATSIKPRATAANTPSSATPGAESARLAEADAGIAPWRRWGPYLADRQWGTVREDYSENGDCWNSFPHDHARRRAYRWGEDGLLGISDDDGALCFALALWNGKDPILKERLFGLTGPEGNHGEDVKEHYFYLDSTPTHSYMRALYKYPQREFPYARLVDENRQRGRDQAEYELGDTGVLDDSRIFDVNVEYAKAGPLEILVRMRIENAGPEAAHLDVLPTLWFRNDWSWNADASGNTPSTRSRIRLVEPGVAEAAHATLGTYRFSWDAASDGTTAIPLFTENNTNRHALWGVPNETPWVKDAFHDRVINGRDEAVNPEQTGTKAAAWYRLQIPAGGTVTLRLRLATVDTAAPGSSFGQADRAGFDELFARRLAEADDFYNSHGHAQLGPEKRLIARQAAAGLLWSKQFYYLDINPWLDGDAAPPQPPTARLTGRNSDWRHLNNRDIISMPDKWEYPWYAAWDLAFQMLPMARIDPQFAKDQLVLFLREWYMHPNGQIPAYEFAFGDVNPPVHAWACWRVYKLTGSRGNRDRTFLARCFQKLLLNFNWWVNRKDPGGRNLFSGGFLGLDNIGVFDRSRPLPTGGHLEQADGTAWMAFYCGTMLSMALELAAGDPAYEDMATKFFEHFIAITDSINTLGGAGLWDDLDGFYYDQIREMETHGRATPLRVRSLVGMVPLLAVEILESDVIDRLPDFRRRMQWFLDHRKDLPWAPTCNCGHGGMDGKHRLLAIPTRERLERVMSRLMDESEFLSQFGIRSVSKFHEANPYVLHAGGQKHRVDYVPGESTSSLFGGNSNWRGPIWFPLNFLIIEALERYHHFYGDSLAVEFPRGSGRRATLGECAAEIRRRLASLFLPDADGRRPCHGQDLRFAHEPRWRDLIYFYEHFHADTGRGLGASHQTGWTALVSMILGDE
ncbi:MAG: hypothetical protein AMXMBFR58_35680 [Phycisphaerae bacterium]